MAQPTTPGKAAPKKPAAKKAPSALKTAVPKPVAVKAAPVKKAATRAAPTAKPAPSATAAFKAKASEATASVKKEALALRDQAASRARGAATQGKDRAGLALDNISKLLGDAAGTVDDKVGAQYGDYTRKAADAVASFAASLKGKEVDDIVKDTADFVKKSPAVAIGAAAALGFVIARMVKAGDDSPKPAKKSAAKKPATPRTAARKPASTKPKA